MYEQVGFELPVLLALFLPQVLVMLSSSTAVNFTVILVKRTLP